MRDNILKRFYYFIESHIDEIDRNEFEILYHLLDETEDEILYHNVGIFTDILIEVGIDPLANASRVYENMFVNSKQINITLPDSIKKLGRSAFYNAYNLSSIIIPEGVTYIPNECFEECYSMDWIQIPRSVKCIEKGAFSPDHLFLVKCYKDSYADKWADEQGLKTEYLE